MAQFAVVLKDQQWTVFKDAAPLAVHLTRSAALEAAEALAHRAEAEGEAVELVVQDYFGSVVGKHSGGD